MLSVTVLCTLCAGVAEAEAPKLVPNGNFHSEVGLGVSVDNSCSLHTPPLTGAACTTFDSSAGDVFVTGFLNYAEAQLGRSEKFGSSDNLLSSPSSVPTNLFFTPSKENEEKGELPPPHYGVAVNPMNGHLYVANPSGEIAIYDPNTGELLSSFPVPSFSTGSEGTEGVLDNEAQIATDSAGDVYVPNVPENRVLKYSETGNLEFSFTGSGTHTLKRPTGVAIDSSNNVWVADDGNNRVEEFSPTGACLGEFASKGVRALALDGHGDVLAIVDNSVDFCGSLVPPCDHLVEYSSSGAQLVDVGAGNFGDTKNGYQSSMVAVDQTSGRVYVTDGLKNLVSVFRPPLAPVLGQESAAEVGTFEAKLGALVNPGGVQTTYYFEYDTRAYGEGEGPHGVSVPFPEGSAGEGFSSRTVWASAKGLLPDTTYHYRAIVTNALGTVVGPDRTFTTLTAAQVECSNEQERGGFSAALPDCRAYELVSPASKDSAQPDAGHTEGKYHLLAGGGYGGNYAASDGNRFSYVSLEVMPGSRSAGLEFIATHGVNGWVSEDALPPQPYTGDRCTIKEDSVVLSYSSDLSNAVLAVDHTDVKEPAFIHQCLAEAVEVVSGEPLGAENLLLRNNVSGTYQLIDVTPPGVMPTPPSLVAASADLSVVIFEERAKLTPDALNNTVNLYEWSKGFVHLLKFVLPSGAPTTGSLVRTNPISPDGSDIFFTAGGNLYVRLHGGERTVQLDEARGGSGPGGGGTFAAVTTDGSEVFFTDDAAAGLTSDTIPGSGTNLYRYNVNTGQLSDLTPAGDAQASLLGISEDGSYVYFSSAGVLPGTQANQFGETAQNGHSNLYLDYNETITFVMQGTIMSPGAYGEPFRISPNGAFFAFNSTNSLTGYNNSGYLEIYLYSAASNRFECASCNPSGEAPTAEENGLKGVILGGAPHSVSDNGQVFFQTKEALLPRDTNGATDVYEFDYGSGLHLISTGTSASESFLLDSSPSGNDVFFLTRQGLVAQDNLQEANKIYDARVDGGFSETALPPACTTADACRSAVTPQPSIYGTPSSQTFSGVGNFAPPVETKSKKKGKGTTKNRKTCRRGKRRHARCAMRSSRKATSRRGRGGRS